MKKKRLFVMLLAVMFLIQCSAAGVFAAYVSDTENPQVLINEDYEELEVNSSLPAGWTVSEISEADITAGSYAKIAQDTSTKNTTKTITLFSGNNASAVTAKRQITIPEGGGIVKLAFEVYPRKNAGWDKKVQLYSGDTLGLDIIYNDAKNARIYNDDGTKVVLGPENQGSISEYEITVNCSENTADGMKPGEYTITYGLKGSTTPNTVSGQLINGLTTIDALSISSGAVENKTNGIMMSVDNLTATYYPLSYIEGGDEPEEPEIYADKYSNWKGVTWSAGNAGENIIADDISDIKDLGLGWTRISAGQNFDMNLTDKMVMAAENADVNVLIRYAKKTKLNIYGTEEEEAAEAAYLSELVNRYKNIVKHWEIGNEPNLKSNWDIETVSDETTSITNYIKHMRDSYRVIKEADPDAVVLLGGLSESNAAAFVEKLGTITLDDGSHAYDWFDEVAFHPYGSTPNQVINTLNTNLKTPMNTYWGEAGNKPIWITEIGFHAMSDWQASQCPGKVDSEEIKANYLTQTMELLQKNLSKTRPVMWYNLHEKGSSNGYGLTAKSYSNGTVSKQRLAAYDEMKSIDTGVSSSALPVYDNFDGKAAEGEYVVPDGWYSTPAISDMEAAKYVSVQSSATEGNTTDVLKIYNNAKTASAATAEREISLPEGGGLVKISFDLCVLANDPGYSKTIYLMNDSNVGVEISYKKTGIKQIDPKGTGASTDAVIGTESADWVRYEFVVNCSDYVMDGMKPGAYTVKVGDGNTFSGQMKNSLKTINKIKFDPSKTANTFGEMSFEIDNFAAELILETKASEFSGISVKNGTAYINAVSYGSAQKGDIIVAAYRESSGVLSRIVYVQPQLLLGKGVNGVEIPIGVAEEGESYKVFFFDSLCSIKPLMHSKAF